MFGCCNFLDFPSYGMPFANKCESQYLFSHSVIHSWNNIYICTDGIRVRHRCLVCRVKWVSEAKSIILNVWCECDAIEDCCKETWDNLLLPCGLRGSPIIRLKLFLNLKWSKQSTNYGTALSSCSCPPALLAIIFVDQ